MKRSAYSQEHFTTIVYPKFGGQTERITGGWKIKTTRLELKVFQTKPTDLIIGVKLLPFFYETKLSLATRFILSTKLVNVRVFVQIC